MWCFQGLINSLACWFCRSALGLILWSDFSRTKPWTPRRHDYSLVALLGQFHPLWAHLQIADYTAHIVCTVHLWCAAYNKYRNHYMQNESVITVLYLSWSIWIEPFFGQSELNHSSTDLTRIFLYCNKWCSTLLAYLALWCGCDSRIGSDCNFIITEGFSWSTWACVQLNKQAICHVNLTYSPQHCSCVHTPLDELAHPWLHTQSYQCHDEADDKTVCLK